MVVDIKTQCGRKSLEPLRSLKSVEHGGWFSAGEESRLESWFTHGRSRIRSSA